MQYLRTYWQQTRQIQQGLLLIIIFSVGFAFGTQYGVTGAQGNLSSEEEIAFDAFWEAYELVQTMYLEDYEVSDVVEGAIGGMLDSLGDQYTGYMDRETFSMLDEDISGEIQGIGVIIRTIEETGQIEIASVLQNTPAQAGGLRAGDIFFAIDGEEVLGLNQIELAGLVRGPRGTEVKITMLRGEELVDFTITRDRIPVPTVESTVLDGEVGYVRLLEFTPRSREQIDEAFEELNVNELNGLVMDFRGNPGGTLDSAVDIASAFIEEGVIVREEFGNRPDEELLANGNFAGVDVPLVVLVDEGSASASELVAGAWQDEDAATILGETTFGKGTVQIWQPLGNGGGMRLTIARWLTPDGNWIHEAGITPDVVVEWDPEFFYLDVTDEESIAEDVQLQAAVEFLLNGTIPEQPTSTADMPDPVEAPILTQ